MSASVVSTSILKNKSVLRGIGLLGMIGVVKLSSVKIAIEKMKLPLSVDRYILLLVICAF